MLLLLTACVAPPDSGVDTAPPAEPERPVTDTLPSFYEAVPKNLLMVSIDTFRKDQLARYGGRGDAPFLDGKLAEGFVADVHRTCSNWTFPSVMCAMQGATNVDVGYAPDMAYPGDAQMPETTATLPLRLANAGYRTMLVTSNSWFSYDHNSDYGFQFTDRPPSRGTTAIFEQGRQRLSEARAEGVERWYLQLHIKEPHPPYDPPESYLSELEGLPEVPWDLTDFGEHYEMGAAWPEMTEEERELLLQHLWIRYRGEVRWMDDQLALQFRELEREGWLEDTLVVFWTDHGEQFWEHGEQTHGYDLHGEENDALLAFWAEDIVPGAWSEPTSHIDLAPTVLGLLGVDDVEGLTGAPLGEADPERPVHTLTLGRLGLIQGVVVGDWKLRYRWNTGERSVFDTVADPGELEDRYDPTDPRVIALEAALAPVTEALVPLAPEHTPR